MMLFCMMLTFGVFFMLFCMITIHFIWALRIALKRLASSRRTRPSRSTREG